MANMLKLLIVEDDPLVTELYHRLFGFYKYNIKTAVNGKEGVESAKSFKPDLILLDIMMPVMDGIEALRLLKQDPTTKEIPVILLTNIDDESAIKEAMELGAADYMVKSDFTPNDIIEQVNRYLKIA